MDETVARAVDSVHNQLARGGHRGVDPPLFDNARGYNAYLNITFREKKFKKQKHGYVKEQRLTSLNALPSGFSE